MNQSLASTTSSVGHIVVSCSVFNSAVPLVMAFCLAIFFASPAWAVDCVPASIGLWSQADVDNFQNEYGPCDRVLSLFIEGADITNLDGLADLTEVGSSLQVTNNPVLIDIRGLASLAKTGRNLWIDNNDALTNLDGLSALASVGAVLAIIYNDQLKNIDGLSSLVSTGATLGIWYNDRLENVDGLSSLTMVGAEETSLGDQGWLHIRGNPSLTDLDGLSALVSVSNVNLYGGVIIDDNASLSNVNGLSHLEGIWGDMIIVENPALISVVSSAALTRVHGIEIYKNTALATVQGPTALSNIGSLAIYKNDALTELAGFDALTQIHGNLAITDNDALTDISTLAGLVSVGNRLEVQSNLSLAQCGALLRLIDPMDDENQGPGVGDVPDVGGEITIGENLPGCNSISEILASMPLAFINAGLNDAWFNLETDGQGFFIIVFPDIEQIFMAWFTYDTERPPADVTAFLGEVGHRWLTAQGEYEENVAILDVFVTVGGVFDSSQPITVTEPDGEIILEFNTCNAGTVIYDIPSIDRQGVVPIERITLDNVSLCYVLGNQAESDAASESE
ncbi:hypothetical protein ACFL1V_07510 [Pseudomonadota bacterium]